MAEIKSDVTKPVRTRRTKSADSGAPTAARKSRANKKADAAPVDGKSNVTPEQRYRMIAENAYHRAEQRGFVGGDSLNDWLLAELEVDRQLKAS